MSKYTIHQLGLSPNHYQSKVEKSDDCSNFFNRLLKTAFQIEEQKNVRSLQYHVTFGSFAQCATGPLVPLPLNGSLVPTQKTNAQSKAEISQ